MATGMRQITLRHRLEYAFFTLVRLLCLCLPFASSSRAGGWLLKCAGPFISRSKKARLHIRLCFPEFNQKQVDRVVSGMWENLGRTLAEFPHMQRLDINQLNQVLRVEGLEHLDAVADSGCVLMGAHLANWEIIGLALALRGYALSTVYRESDNPLTNHAIQRIRHRYMQDALPKGREGAKKMLRAIKDGRVVYVLMDQKLKEGVSIKFFGRPSKTGTAIARLALEYKRPIFPVQVVRTNGHRLLMRIEPPLELEPEGQAAIAAAVNKKEAKEAQAVRLMTRFNAILEGWIREHPEQWIWLHHRWHKRLPEID